MNHVRKDAEGVVRTEERDPQEITHGDQDEDMLQAPTVLEGNLNGLEADHPINELPGSL
ncbi:MAG: hypothetical protein PVF56_02660 [Desulfobacterales bacterium]